MSRSFAAVVVSFISTTIFADEPVAVWPGLAPGETTRLTGETLPFRDGEDPPVVRVEKITCPTFAVFRAPEPNGTGVVILPGGGFGRVVTNKEGSEAAEWLNRLGVTAFVLSYRTRTGRSDPGWVRPLQDAQRLMSRIRSEADQWGLRQDRIGLLGFSAGGNVAARLLTSGGQRAYERVDAIDDVSHRPDFGMLLYPAYLYDNKTTQPVEGIAVTKDCPPAFIVHTDDDRLSSLGSVHFYAGLKQLGIPAELHVYGNGGHGYGLRPIEGSQISSWPNHAAHWLATRGLLQNGDAQP